ncbi:hypothetical protein [Rothia kristinae]|uniref:hypothetical protein n=1 Tax=Rothia kristinae TaxID=37923 RepID=UPI0007914557|nr:hypothetical protein [Rothia kristinae]KTR32179.1 hypothetical protein RSA5_09985 [Rothia kristinae]
MAFKLFRGSAEPEPKQPRQRPADGGAGAAPATGSEPRPESGGIRALSPREEVPAGGGLPELLCLMDRYGVRTLRLDQHGNEMTATMDPSEKPERKTTVDTESTWFDAVASLYTAAQSGPRGPGWGAVYRWATASKRAGSGTTVSLCPSPSPRDS